MEEMKANKGIIKKKEEFMWSFLEKIPWFWLGFSIILLLAAPYFVLGSHCYVQITDQLDGEVVNYIYHAKYLFSGENVIPEFMCGQKKSAMTPPAPIGVLFYRLLPPFAAFAAMHIFVAGTGYTGMYLLGKQLSGSKLIACVTAGIFVCLPFYPVYGLSILGQPMLFWAVLNCCKKKCRVKKWKYYLCILLYAAGTSLALSGFACIGLLAGVWLWCFAKKDKRLCRELGIILLLLFICFLCCNGNLIGGVFGFGENIVSHREEMLLVARNDWWELFKEIFLEGGLYAKSYNKAIAALTVIVLLSDPLLSWMKYKKRIFSEISGDGAYKTVAVLFLLTFCISIGVVIWQMPYIVDLRVHLGGAAKSFQANRIYWMLPVCWYAILALDLYILLRKIKGCFLLRWGLSAAAVIFLCFTVYENSTIYHNLRLMIFPDTYHLMNWEDYYAEDVYQQIGDFLGEDKSCYRVASLGINPAAALYNGFYVLDGYSNYYSLDYKHEFREIIAKELEKNEETRIYFDTWGNRCYLLNAETGNYMTIEKNGGASSYKNLELNTKKMYEMGARYLFAAMPIDNKEQLGLVPVREEPFETPESYYAIWVYEILEQ